MTANVRPVWNSSKPSLSDINWESGPDRKLAHNTYRVSGDGWVGVRYHGTVIIRTDHNETDGMGYVVTSGGYRTSTTKQRLNALMPGGWHIHQKDYVWYLTTREGTVEFEDRMRIAY